MIGALASGHRARIVLIVSAGLLLANGCEKVGPNRDAGTEDGGTDCQDGEYRCWLNFYERCENGVWISQERCDDPTPYCVPELGCMLCPPGSPYCDGNTVMVCNADGTAGTIQQQCDETVGELCMSGSCLNACEVAEETRSYIGCDYWPTPTSNWELQAAFDYNFGVAVHNANPAPAQVIIEQGGWVVDQQEVGPGELHTFELEIDLGLKLMEGFEESRRALNAAYHLTASLPVTVYQFNPLDYAIDMDVSYCPIDDAGGYYPPCHSYSNDASLLLPRHVWSTHYIAMAYKTWGANDSVFYPGFLAVLAVEDDTQVTVRSSAYTEPGPSLTALAPGDEQIYTLAAGEVLQLINEKPSECTGTEYTDYVATWCDMEDQYDFTGTTIESSAPVAVFAGHPCGHVPFYTRACDHLEEQIIPLEAWGKTFVVGRTEVQSHTAPEPNVVRLLSGEDGNVVTLDPPHPELGATVTLDEGVYVDFETREDLVISGSGALLVGQYLVGQAYPDTWMDWGDPAFAQVVPVEQYRTQYTFLAPASITVNYVNVVKPVGESSPVVYLDGVPVEDASFVGPIGASSYGVARLPITGEAHRIECSVPVGITVYGFAYFTSYMYPGGLDLREINPVL